MTSASTPTSTLDLTNNFLDIANGNLSVITSLIGRGYNNWLWTGTGITSSTAAASASGGTYTTALGVIQNSTDGSASGPILYPTFDGAAVSATDVLVRYTYCGDANLERRN